MDDEAEDSLLLGVDSDDSIEQAPILHVAPSAGDIGPGPVQDEKEKKSWSEDDRCSLVYILFLIQGCAILLPFNAYINCPDYFMHLFGDQVMTEISSVYMALNFLALILLTVFGQYLSSIITFLLPYLFFIPSLAVVPILGGWVRMSSSLGLGLTLVLVCGTGLSTALLQSAVFGFAYVFPSERYSQALMAGNGIIGIVVSLVRIITKVTLERHATFEEYRNSATLYFALAAFFMIFAFISYTFLYIVPFSRRILSEASSASVLQKCVRKIRGQNVNEEPEPTGSLVSSPVFTTTGGPETEDDLAFLQSQKTFWEHRKDDCGIYWHALKINIHNALYLFGIFFVSLSVFPGLSSVIPTSFPTTWMKDWFSVIITTLFTLFDWIGRQLPSFFKMQTEKWVWAIVLARFAFIVLFWLCIHPVWWLHHDLIPFTMMVVMAFTNGYFSTCVLMDSTSRAALKSKQYARRVVSSVIDRKKLATRIESVSGVICTTFMVGGICIGSWCSLALFQIQKAIYQ